MIQFINDLGFAGIFLVAVAAAGGYTILAWMAAGWFASREYRP